MAHDISIHERLATLEEQVRTIIENHLPHLEEAVNQLNIKFWAIILLLFTNLGALIVMLIEKI